MAERLVDPAVRQRLAGLVLVPATGLAGASVFYLLALLAAAARGDAGRTPLGSTGELRIVCLVPAHDEAEGIEPCLESLSSQEYPAERREVIVVADNCTDATAAVSAQAGATVWERDDPARRGKGHALTWALQRLRSERQEVDYVVFVDADCIASPNLLEVVAEHAAAGASAIQVGYRVANAESSTESALRAAGFLLMHDVRAQGKSALGLSCGLFGTGMALSTEVLAQVPWSGSAVTEDTDYHLRLVQAGVVVRYAGGASVASDMPTTARAAREQHLRWEGGNASLARRQTPELLLAGLRRRDPQILHAGLERLVPAQSLLLALSVGTTAGSMASRRPWQARIGLSALLGQVVYVLAGLRVARAPAASWRALASVPALVLRRLGLAGRIAREGGPTEWVRTERTPG